MGRAKVAAQAQAQALATISHTESLELVRCLLRVSIFHVSYLRGLFPDGSFKGVDMKNLDGMHIKMLMPACDESRRLIDWVEGGVNDAIKKGYLKKLFFGISTDPEGTRLLEEYVFNFTYGEDGSVAMDVTGGATGNKGKKKGEKVGGQCDVSSVRYQVCRLMRMLVQVCQTLDRVPSERYLFMKLTYHDNTPDDYEPPYFIPVDNEQRAHFMRKPFAMEVGQVATAHHQVSLKVKSVLDACDEQDGPSDGQEEVMGSAQQSTSQQSGPEADALMADADKRAEDSGERPAGEAADPKRRAQDDLVALMSEPQAKAASEPLEDPMSTDATECPIPTEYMPVFEKVKIYCMKRAKVDATDVMTQFMEVPMQMVQIFMSELCSQGMLERAGAGKDTYKVLMRSATQADVCSQPKVDPADRMVQAMTSLTMMDDTSGGHDQTRKMSQHGCDVTNMAGGEATQSVFGKRAAREPDGDDGADQMVFFDQSQHSNRRAEKAQKVSYVADPIQQGKAKKQRTARGDASARDMVPPPPPAAAAPTPARKAPKADAPPSAAKVRSTPRRGAGGSRLGGMR